MLNLQQITKTESILLPTVFKSISDNRVFKKTEYREPFIKNINSLLSLRDSRHTALSTLNIFCDHHFIPLLTEKTCPEVIWLDQLLRIIEQDLQFHSLCFDIIGKLLKITSCNPDTNKIVQSKYIQKIIDAAVGSSVSPLQSLNCLAICFELHGGTSGIYKNKIYDYCVSFIDVPDEGVAAKSALCIHLLQQSRGGSNAGGVYKKCWAEFHDKTIGSLETLLDQIAKKPGEKNGKSEQLQLPELKLSPELLNRYTQLLVRLQNIATILRESLKHPFATAKAIQVSRIISLVEDGVAFGGGKKSLSENIVFSLMMGQIQVNLLDALRSLIFCLGQNIIMHSKSICDVFWSFLKQTSSNEHLKYETNLKLRNSVYETFICFMRISPNNIHIKNIMENLMKEVLMDVTPANEEIYLMMPQGGAKSNKRKKINAEKKFSKGKGHVANIIEDQKVCAKALECLAILLVYHGALMKPVLFYILQEKIISIGFAISSKTQHEKDLYRDPLCRSKLSDLVGLLMIHPVHKMPVPINYGIALLTTIKQSDPDLNVRNVAEMNLHRAETTIHNKKDLFFFSADYKDFKDTLMFNKQIVQKFNQKTNIEEIFEGENEREIDEIVEINDAEDEKFVMSSEDDEVVGSFEGDEIEKVNLTAIELSVENEDEAQEISDEEIMKPVEDPKAVEKRPSEEVAKHNTRSKKQKVSDKKDDEIVDEMLADFSE